MKVLVVMNAFKGSLTSAQAGEAVSEGIARVNPNIEIEVRLLADGGEGTTDAMIQATEAQRIGLKVKGPLGNPVKAYYGYLEETKTAFMEIAMAAGYSLIKEEDKNPMTATTYGVGEMIRHAIEKGCRNFVIGVGGSVTNDGGIGMLQALGYRFYNQQGIPVGQGAQALGKVASISSEDVLPELEECTFVIACDVENTLCGRNGTTYVYGPQKGILTENMKHQFDAGMRNFAKVTGDLLGSECENIPGSGAGGGLGFAFSSYLHAKCEYGTELIIRETGLEASMKDCDYIVTGEGCLDAQSIMGKGPIGIAHLGQKYRAKVIAFTGTVNDETKQCQDCGVDAYFPIIRDFMTRKEAMQTETAYANLADTAEQVFRLL